MRTPTRRTLTAAVCVLVAESMCRISEVEGFRVRTHDLWVLFKGLAAYDRTYSLVVPVVCPGCSSDLLIACMTMTTVDHSSFHLTPIEVSTSSNIQGPCRAKPVWGPGPCPLCYEILKAHSFVPRHASREPQIKVKLCTAPQEQTESRLGTGAKTQRSEAGTDNANYCDVGMLTLAVMM